MSYAEFLSRKATLDAPTGIDTDVDLPQGMFPFQRDIVRWAVRRGRAAIFAQTGLGKSLMELAWADAVHRETGRNVIVLTPLAVAAQMVDEGNKFGLSSKQCASQSEVEPGITVTNYEKIRHFDLSEFAGVVLDESSILKAFDGKTRNALIQMCQSCAFRLAATATPAPNDYMELGNHAEFLGVMSYTGMLATYFTHDSKNTSKWRLKGHADAEFWYWMASWSVMIRRPSDLGYDNAGYDLPPLRQDGYVVPVPGEAARTMGERLRARRATLAPRVAAAIAMTPPEGAFVWWCNLNDESAALAAGIPGAVELRGADKESEKQRKLADFSAGRIRVLVTKPKICGFGMNWQHCCDTGFVGLNDSFEQVYQSIRRFWRFGQKKPVTVRFISASTEGAVVENLKRKERDAERMALSMVAHTADITSEHIRGAVRIVDAYYPPEQMALPNWIYDND